MTAEKHALPLSVADIQKAHDDFLYVVAHDFSATIRHVREFSRLLKEELAGQLDPSAQQLFDFLQRATDRQDGMLKGLLRLSRLTTEVEDKVLTDTGALVQEIAADVRALYPAAVITVDASLPSIPVAPSQFRTLWGELLTNAARFHEDPDAARVHVSAHETETEAVFAIADNGIGFDARLFQQYCQIFRRGVLEKEYSGLGVGLALCEKIVALHGGRMAVETESEKGTTVFVHLPV